MNWREMKDWRWWVRPQTDWRVLACTALVTFVITFLGSFLYRYLTS